MDRWFAVAAPILVAAVLVLALGNALLNPDQGAWLAVAGVATLLAAMLAAGPGRFR